ncbi:hypothetical protein QX51_15225 [Terrisporobacter othiniensis]|uniref:Uncharacterized protein n=1 Tax=Terrisporobacter othiniensis TaxID=1577792 RepID=A0A0B3W1G8_9FIRM|nr:hypothetical protein [Terrisporobacter othiniensis]KHS56122.1 hypothetical protein QX51_15225 [Terrisporobacter othiniensis]
MKNSAIRIDKCVNVQIDNVKTTGFDNAIYATDTKELSATNINATKDSNNFDELICSFNELIKESPFDSEIIIQANEVALEIKKGNKESNKVSKFIDSIEKIYNFIDKSGSLAKIILSISKFIENM